MLTGVVVESFSYVFQLPGKASLDREEIRESRSVPHSSFHLDQAESYILGLQVCSRRHGLSSTVTGPGTFDATNSCPSSA